ncbi:hypothetical protein RRF57_011205 [Xylaria bambusicola]|uniref:Uncharacterized protein n=1 Tax=Xylaria bambusicola TaxID=326684 RepID=A0AAN7UXR3_9PEZI
MATATPAPAPPDVVRAGTHAGAAQDGRSEWVRQDDQVDKHWGQKCGRRILDSHPWYHDELYGDEMELLESETRNQYQAQALLVSR